MSDRAYCLSVMLKLGAPIFEACAKRELRLRLPKTGHPSRYENSYLEVVARHISGIAPWLDCPQDDPDEEAQRLTVAASTRDAIDAITDPESPDCAIFEALSPAPHHRQPVVDASYLALAMLRAPVELWEKLDPRIQDNVIMQLDKSRKILPFRNNWLLFSAMIEVFYCKIGKEWDQTAVDYALYMHSERWYLGDGVYSDGEQFRWDYYNAFVIQPYLVEIYRHLGPKQEKDWDDWADKTYARARRYAEIQENMISPEGTFPPFGRSLAYRFGAFQSLAQSVWFEDYPHGCKPAQIRGALTAVIRRMIEAPGTWDDNGWLNFGFCGHQPDIAEVYLNVGSQYLCSNVFLILGLPASNPFWSDPAHPWTSQQFFGGMPITNSKSLEGRIADKSAKAQKIRDDLARIAADSTQTSSGGSTTP